jgi:hypothetical protein
MTTKIYIELLSTYRNNETISVLFAKRIKHYVNALPCTCHIMFSMWTVQFFYDWESSLIYNAFLAMDLNKNNKKTGYGNTDFSINAKIYIIFLHKDITINLIN